MFDPDFKDPSRPPAPMTSHVEQVRQNLRAKLVRRVFEEITIEECPVSFGIQETWDGRKLTVREGGPGPVYTIDKDTYHRLETRYG